MAKLKAYSISLRDDSLKEIQKRAKEKFEIHRFMYIEDTLTSEERRILRERGTEFQMFADGKIKGWSEEHKQVSNGPDNSSESVSKEVQVWFKYLSMLKSENEGRKSENKKRAKENANRYRPYHGE